jgi:preprotein translocase subunit YajC
MSFLFLDYNDLLVILTPILVVFGILLFLGIRKSYKLKKENEKLAELSEELTHEDDDTYEDFTDGHMYQ